MTFPSSQPQSEATPSPHHRPARVVVPGSDTFHRVASVACRHGWACFVSLPLSPARGKGTTPCHSTGIMFRVNAQNGGIVGPTLVWQLASTECFERDHRRSETESAATDGNKVCLVHVPACQVVWEGPGQNRPLSRSFVSQRQVVAI
jgi:hypothetical protein